MKKYYELTVLVNPEEEQAYELGRIELMLEQQGATKTKYDDEGEKRLVYPIEGCNTGYYHYYHLYINPENVRAISRWLENEQSVLRYLLVSIDPKVEAQDKIERAIEDWVAENYGGSEVDDPSWNITELAKHLNNKLKIYKEEE